MRYTDDNFLWFFQSHLGSLGKKPRDEKELQAIMDNFIESYNEALINESLRYKKPVTEETAETSEDFLELAENAENQKQALKYARQAYKLNEFNIDAAILYFDLSIKNLDKHLSKVKKYFENVTAKYKADGIFDEALVGNFHDYIELRPYLRLSQKYMLLLARDFKMRQAVAIANEMLRLDEADHLGVRHVLMHYYAQLEDEKAAMELYEKFNQDVDAHFLLPISLLYYKLGDEIKALHWLREVAKFNNNTKNFFDNFGTPHFEEYVNEFLPYGYRFGEIDEIWDCVQENSRIYDGTPTFFDWAKRALKNPIKRK